jgi:hypothetical protein
VGGDPVGDEKQPFESERALHLWTAREIVARHGGRLVAAHATEAIVLIVLPIA